MKKILAVLLAALMAASMLPTFAFAAAGEHSIRLEAIKDAESFPGKEVLRLDFLYKSGTELPQDQMVYLKFDANVLTPLLQAKGEDAGALMTDFSANRSAGLTKNPFTADDGFGGTIQSEVMLYPLIAGGFGYYCWKVTEPAGTPAFGSYTRVSSVFFGLNEGVRFDAIPGNAITFSDPKTDGGLTAATQAALITANDTPYEYLKKNGTDTMTAAPVIAAGSGVTFGKALPREEKPEKPEEKPGDKPVLTFTDLEGHWGKADVLRAAELGLFNGYADGRFGPDDNITRAQFVTVLWRMAGSPATDGKTPFADIAGQSAEFRSAIAWGYQKGYVNGVSDTAFNPTGNLTREAAMKILFLYSGGVSGMEMLFTSVYDSQYSDSGKISAWAKAPMYWGIYNCLISGTSETTLSPGTPATRAQLAKILVQYIDKNTNV